MSLEISLNKTLNPHKKIPYLFVGGMLDGKIRYVPSDVTQRIQGDTSRYYGFTAYKYVKTRFLYGFVFLLHRISKWSFSRDEKGNRIDGTERRVR